MPEIEFPPLRYHKVIIVVKGHPFTGKAQIAQQIGVWARCQVFYIDYFLDAFSLERGYTFSSPPSMEESDCLHRLALDALYTVASRYLRYSDVVVIKSRLSSAFELDLLIRLFNVDYCKSYIIPIVIIIECGIQNEYRWRTQVKQYSSPPEDQWYKIRTWMDIEKIKEDYCIDSQAFDLRLLSSLEVNSRGSTPSVTRLVLDYFDHFDVNVGLSRLKLTRDFKHALIYFINMHVIDEYCAKYKVRYVALFQLDQVRRYLLDKELDTSRKRSKYLCSNENTNAGCCIFKYWEELLGGEFKGSCCRVCEEKLVSGQPAYTCHFCILTLHKSCAETALDFTFLDRLHDEHETAFGCEYELYSLFAGKCIACKSCNEKGKHSPPRCQACVFETHLRRGVLPTIINHDCHQLHFLSMQFLCYFDLKTCSACGKHESIGGYVCHICNVFYDMECVFLPDQVKHEHGGHEHVMKLMYSHEGIEQEDDHWCNSCYIEMDPQNWFYCCQECPYYVTHARIECVGRDRIQQATSKANLPIKLLRDKFNQR